MTETKLYDLTGVEVFDVGTWNGHAYTDEDLNEMVANFDELSAAGYDFPAKLGHGEQELLEREDLPAAAYIKRLYRKGTKLVADFTRVPEKVKQCIDVGAYRTVSAEIYGKVSLLGKTYDNVVRAIAFLGADIPAVGTLDDVIALYNRAGAKPTPLMFSTATRHVATWTPQKEEDVADSKAAKDSVDDEVTELDAELTKLAERAADATKGRTGAPAFRAFLRDTITKLRGLATKTSTHAAADMSFEERRDLVSSAVRAKWGSVDGYGAWITEMYDATVIVQRDASYFQIPYAIDDNDNVVLGDAVEVEQIWQPKATATTNKAGNTGKEDDMAITKALATALGLPETADEPAVLKAIADKDAKITALEADAKTFSARVTALEARNKTTDAEAKVDAAIREKKLLPADRDAMVKFAIADLAGFDAFIKDRKPTIDTAERGSGKDAPEAQSDVATFQAKVAEKVKAGETVEAAQRAVAAEEPELYSAIRARR